MTIFLQFPPACLKIQSHNNQTSSKGRFSRFSQRKQLLCPNNQAKLRAWESLPPFWCQYLPAGLKTSSMGEHGTLLVPIFTSWAQNFEHGGGCHPFGGNICQLGSKLRAWGSMTPFWCQYSPAGLKIPSMGEDDTLLVPTSASWAQNFEHGEVAILLVAISASWAQNFEHGGA